MLEQRVHDTLLAVNDVLRELQQRGRARDSVDDGRRVRTGGEFSLIAALELVSYLRWRSPPDKAIARLEVGIEPQRAAGVLSRAAVALIGLFAFLVALGLMIVMPMG